jgi:hypothetical protein
MRSVPRAATAAATAASPGFGAGCQWGMLQGLGTAACRAPHTSNMGNVQGVPPTPHS